MTTPAANPKKPASKVGAVPAPRPPRSMTYHADLGVAYLTVGKEPCTGYYLDGRRDGAWVWTKFGTREQYTVRAGRCDCKGFTRWARCKHQGATVKLLELGRIGGAK